MEGGKLRTTRYIRVLPRHFIKCTCKSHAACRLLLIIAPSDFFLARDSIYSIVRYMLSPDRLSVRHPGGSVKDG